LNIECWPSLQAPTLGVGGFIHIGRDMVVTMVTMMTMMIAMLETIL
jgi:hypothetical protein